jgi:MFS family permease
MISSYFGSKMLIRFGKNVLLCGLAIILISFILHVIFLNEGTRSLTIIGLIGLYGLGNGAVLPFLLNVVLDDVKPDDASIASGIFSTFQQVASALGIAIIGGFFYGSLHGETAADYKNALDSGLLTGSFFSFLVALMLLVGKNLEIICCLTVGRKHPNDTKFTVCPQRIEQSDFAGTGLSRRVFVDPMFQPANQRTPSHGCLPEFSHASAQWVPVD